MTALPLFDAVPAAPVVAGTRPLVVGLDLSLTSLGVAGEGWTDCIRPKLRGDARLDYLETTIKTFIRRAELVVIEGPSYGHTGPRFHIDLAALHKLVHLYCHRSRIPYAVISPSTLKVFVAGHGKADKGEIRTAIAERYGVHTEGPARYDEADAYGCMAAGLHWLGQPLAEVPEKNAAALERAQWPAAAPIAA